ncbi:hypothetical protein Tco_1020129 [Tanacetum coccineum]|uniref:Reverse transcriptase domain-containing protein n=1 Tax=Tanacetum coccineum TaxID=301880 RepID=A0ABQ5FZ82_9ASTR
MDDLPHGFWSAENALRRRIGFEYGLSSSKGWTNYHSSIQCAPFGALYGRKCRSWAEIRESMLIRLELVQETTDKVVLIKENLKETRDRQKSYADNRHKLLDFKDEISLRRGYCDNHDLSRKPLEFQVGDHVMLKVSPWKGVVSLDEIKVDKTLHFVEEPLEIMDRKVKTLKRSKIPIVKVDGIPSVDQSLPGNVRII